MFHEMTFLGSYLYLDMEVKKDFLVNLNFTKFRFWRFE